MTRSRPQLACLGGPPTVTAREREAALVSPAARRAVARFMAGTRRDGFALSDLEGDGAVGRFEQAFAAAVGARHAVALPTGTSALMAMLAALRIGPGDEVVVAAYGWGSTVGAVLAVGATPRFADISGETACLDPCAIQAALSPRTRAILATHMFGNPADVAGLQAVADAHGLHLLLDGAQALGARLDGVPLGAMGTATGWSFGRHKLLYAGEGGAVTTDDPSVYEALVIASQHPARARRQVLTPESRTLIDEVSLSMRMHPLAAVIAEAALPSTEAALARRRTAVLELHTGLEGLPGITLTVSGPPAMPAFYQCALRYEPEALGGLPRSAFVAALIAEGVPAVPGPVRIPLHLRPRWRAQWSAGSLPVAERRCHAEELLIESPSRWTGGTTRRTLQIVAAIRKVVAAAPALRHISDHGGLE